MIKYSARIIPFFILLAMLLTSNTVLAQSKRGVNKKAERLAKREAKKAARLAKLYADSDFQDDDSTVERVKESDTKTEEKDVVKIEESKSAEEEDLSHSMAIPDQIQFRAERLLGIPYRYGGMDSKGYDCSGLSCHVFAQLDIQIPRTAQAQYVAADIIPLRKAEKGDLVFFGKSKTKVSHVGIVISKRGEPLQMIHASTSSGIIITDVDTSAYWKPKLVGIGRYVSARDRSATSQR